MPVFVPAADLEKAKADAATAKAAQAAEIKTQATRRKSTAASTPERFTSTTPGIGKRVTLWACSRCGMTTSSPTYAASSRRRRHSTRLKDGKPSLINFDFAGGLYTIPKEVSHGYLTIGKKKVQFDQIAEAK